MNHWEQNLQHNRQAVEDSLGPGLVAIVSGSASDQQYWQARFQRTRREVFRRDGSTRIDSIHEALPRGNFLGTLCVWDEFKRPGGPLAGGAGDERVLISMLFGKGTRLSPFTQALGNCKPRFPTPYRFEDLHLSIGECSTLYSSLLVRHLHGRGFDGAVVKWGDEIMLPGADWLGSDDDFSQVDAVRFAWFTQPTPELAREKEWILADAQDGHMLFQLVRQPQEALLARAESKQGDRRSRLGVNLGSLAASYALLDLMKAAFAAELYDPRQRVDWDPYVWLALSCATKAEWLDEAAYQRGIGIRGMEQLLERIPDFYARLVGVRGSARKAQQPPLHGQGAGLWRGVLDRFRAAPGAAPEPGRPAGRGRARPPDPGLIPPARGQGRAWQSPGAGKHPRPRRYSELPDRRRRDPRPETLIHGGIVIGGSYGRISMPQGGIAMFGTAGELDFDGPNAIAFQPVLPSLRLPEGGRHATVLTQDGPLQLFTNEAITDYRGDAYTQPLEGNPVSFDEAARLVDKTSSPQSSQSTQS